MKIRIKAFGELRKLLGAELKLELPSGTTIGELLLKLSKDYPALKSKVLDPDGRSGHYLVLINGRNIQFMNQLKTKLSEKDTISLLPPSGGG